MIQNKLIKAIRRKKGIKMSKNNKVRKINKINQTLASILLGVAILGGGEMAFSAGVQVGASMVGASTQGKIIESDPNIFTEKVGEQFFKAMKDNQSQIKQNPNILKSMVEKNVLPYVNVKYVGAKIMGPRFKSFDESERQRYFQKLEKYLIANYAQVFTLYKGQEVKYLKVPYSNEEMVKTKAQIIQPQGQPVNVHFSLRRNSKTNEWQLFDITAEGVSFVESKTSEWRDYFKDKAKFEELLQYLDKIAQSDISISK